MLSPGRYHAEVPRDPAENVRYRTRLLDWVAAGRGDARRECVRRMCQDDLLFYVNAFAVQVNPNPWEGAWDSGPFCTYPFQDAALTYGDGAQPGLLQCVEERQEVVVEKSRELGASWLVLMLFDWLCRFHKRKTFYVLSRSEEAVDSHEKGALFPKLRFLQKYLPPWLSPPPVDKALYFGYPWNDSEIAGAAATKAAKVGGRATAVLFDEFARFAEQRKGADHAVLKATRDVSRCRIFVSTHLGVGTAYHGLTERPDVRKVVLHWSMHPVKGAGLYRLDPDSRSPDKIDRLDPGYEYPANYPFVADGRPTGGPFPGLRSPWYDEECRVRADDRDCAVNLDIDVKSAVKQFFDPYLVERLKKYDCKPPLWEGDVHADPDTGELLSLVPRAGGPLRLWVALDTAEVPRPPRGRYAVGCDVSWGAGATPSCLCVWDATTGQQVGEYADARVKPWEFAALVNGVGRHFHDREGRAAWLVWETAGPGGHFTKRVLELGYPNLFYRVDERKDPPVRSDNPGWFSSPELKRLLLSRYMAALAAGKAQARSAAMLDEVLSLKHDGAGGVIHPRERNNDDESGAGEAHADLGMAAAIGWRMVEEMGLGERRRDDPAGEPHPYNLAGRFALAQKEGRTLVRERWD